MRHAAGDRAGGRRVAAAGGAGRLQSGGLRRRPDRGLHQARDPEAASARHHRGGGAGGLAGRRDHLAHRHSRRRQPDADRRLPDGADAAGGGRRGQLGQHHRRLQRAGFDVRGDHVRGAGLCRLPGRRPGDHGGRADRAGCGDGLLRVELSAGPDLPGRWRRLFPGLLGGRARHPAGAPQSGGLAGLSAAAVRLSDLRDAVHHVPPSRGARPPGRAARCHASAQPDLPPADALGHRQARCGQHAAPQLDDLALSVGAVLAVGRAGGAVVGRGPGAVDLAADVLRPLSGALPRDRAFPHAALPGAQGRSLGCAGGRTLSRAAPAPPGVRLRSEPF